VIAVLLAGGVAFGLMLAELRVSRLHERALRARGAIEPPGDVYRLMAIAYPIVFLAMVVEGAWRAWPLRSVPDIAAGGQPAWAVSGVVLFAAAKWLKYWAIGALGDRWSFKVLIEPARPLVTSGPYRYVSHPNYIAIAGELAGTAMMVGAAVTGPVSVVLFGALLWARIRFEERALGGVGP
jgi:methyltransferase